MESPSPASFENLRKSAHDLWVRGREEQGVARLRKLIARASELDGLDPSVALDFREELADALLHVGRIRESALDVDRLLEERLALHGADHPETLDARSLAAQVRGLSGATAAAVDELTRLVSDRERIQGPDHPSTLAQRVELQFFQAADDESVEEELKSARRLVEQCLGILEPNPLDDIRCADRAGHVSDARRPLRGGRHHARAAAMVAVGTGEREWMDDLADLVSDCDRVLSPSHLMTRLAREAFEDLRSADSRPPSG